MVVQLLAGQVPDANHTPPAPVVGESSPAGEAFAVWGEDEKVLRVPPGRARCRQASGPFAAGRVEKVHGGARGGGDGFAVRRERQALDRIRNAETGRPQTGNRP